jgi:spore coat protein CotH
MMRLGYLGIVLCLLATAFSARAGKKTAKAEDAFFGSDKLYTIHLHLTAEDWELMQPTRRPRPATLVADSIAGPAKQATRQRATTQATVAPTQRSGSKSSAVNGEKLPPNNYGFEYVYVKAGFECDGEKLGTVALRFKGNSSYENFQRSLKRPYKIDFNRFVKGQKFHGLETMNLGNNAFDMWQLREAISYEVYRRAGVRTPRTAFALVYLTVDGQHERQFVGFYTIVEELDDEAFLKQQFGDAGGLLLKPEGIRGLPYMGENWEAYPQRYHSKTTTVDPKLSRRFIDFVKLVNYADDATFNAHIGEYLAIDPLLRYLAATVLITNLDSPLVTNHNFYLYENPADQKVWMLPWDMNLSFASYGSFGSREDAFGLSISHPWAGENKLLGRVMAIAENDRAYRDYLRTFIAQFFNEASMETIVAPMKQALAKADEAALAAKMAKVSGDTGGMRFGRMHTLEDYVPRRVESVLAQLDGKQVATFVPRQNPVNRAFRWGLNTPPEFGSLPEMAQAIRAFADDDWDFQVSGREARDAVAALFYSGVTEAQPDALSERQLAVALAPWVSGSKGESSGGLMAFLRGGPGAPTLWAKAMFRDGDTDHDGKLTLDELTDLVSRLVCLADRDQNSRLDEREIIEGLDMLAVPNPGEEPAMPARGRRR